MSSPYYVHEDDAEEFDRAPNIYNEKLRIVVTGIPEDPWNYYIYSNAGNRMPCRFAKPLSGCEHDFLKYEGLTEIYEYCSKCDKKR